MIKKLLIFFVIFANLHALDDELMDMGKNLYDQTCISCHGPDGAGNHGMNLVVKPRNLTKTILDLQQIRNIISDGSHAWGSRSDFMPAFKYVFDDEEIESLAYFVFHKFVATNTHHQKNKNISDWDQERISLKLGKKIYMRNCSLCHGIQGDGKSEYVTQSKDQENFIYPYNLQKIILTKEQIFLYAKHGGQFWGSSTKDMPAWHKKYDDRVLQSVAQYIEDKVKK